MGTGSLAHLYSLTIAFAKKSFWYTVVYRIMWNGKWGMIVTQITGGSPLKNQRNPTGFPPAFPISTNFNFHHRIICNANRYRVYKREEASPCLIIQKRHGDGPFVFAKVLWIYCIYLIPTVCLVVLTDKRTVPLSFKLVLIRHEVQRTIGRKNRPASWIFNAFVILY